MSTIFIQSQHPMQLLLPHLYREWVWLCSMWRRRIFATYLVVIFPSKALSEPTCKFEDWHSRNWTVISHICNYTWIQWQIPVGSLGLGFGLDFGPWTLTVGSSQSVPNFPNGFKTLIYPTWAHPWIRKWVLTSVVRRSAWGSLSEKGVVELGHKLAIGCEMDIGW
jgi:hypothetical protein